MNYERANAPQTSLNLFEEEVSKLGLAYKLASVGEEPKTMRCWLHHADGTVADVGNGKGIGLQSEISAKYEALEHYLSTRKSDLQNASIPLSFEEIESSLSEVNRKALPSCYIKPNNRFKKTAWLTLQGYFGSSIVVPYFLTNPDYINDPFVFDEFDYSTLSDKPTNNGTAIGTSFEEAMIHAVNELIERDAISYFLLSVFGRKNPKKIRIIDKNSLPLYLREIIAKIEHDYDDELLIVDIMNDLKFPVFLTTFTKQNQLIQPIGFGASLSASYALERAILEALQSLHLYDEDLQAEDALILSKFNQWPKLLKCAQCNLLPLIKSGHYSFSRFHETTEYKLNLHEILTTTIQNLKLNDLHVFYAKHYQSANGVSCVKVVVPGIEQFQRVRLGNFAIPGPRGISVLSNESEHDQ